jgi:threonyl-tRNA synthetase
MSSTPSNSQSLKDFEEPEIHSPVETMRHSAAHVMAHAIQKIWPQAKFGIGPTVENGFYYDVDLPVKLSPEDLPKIEAEMKKIIKAGASFVREEHSIDEAISMFKKMNQGFKVEIIENLRDGAGAKTVSTYKEGDFIDLCRGPHVQKTTEIKAVKLMSVAGAYWRGNEKNPQLQRIYGAAFETQAVQLPSGSSGEPVFPPQRNDRLQSSRSVHPRPLRPVRVRRDHHAADHGCRPLAPQRSLREL